ARRALRAAGAGQRGRIARRGDLRGEPLRLRAHRGFLWRSRRARHLPGPHRGRRRLRPTPAARDDSPVAPRRAVRAPRGGRPDRQGDRLVLVPAALPARTVADHRRLSSVRHLAGSGVTCARPAGRAWATRSAALQAIASAGVPSLKANLICWRSSGVSMWPCTATACWTAASSSSSSVSAAIATVQFETLGDCRQSMYLRVIALSLEWLEEPMVGGSRSAASDVVPGGTARQ